MRTFDWEQTPLGDPERWPLSLKTAVRILLTSQQPMFVWWGPELINLYNDPYRAILGSKHPRALGLPASVVWQEIWDQVGPRVQSAISHNQGTYDEALFLMMERNGYPEETYYTFSYSPIPNDDGVSFGIFCANTDETQRIISGRYLATQRELAARAAEAMTVEEACKRSGKALAVNPYDLPFTLLYLREASGALKLMGRSGGGGEDGFAELNVWPLEEVLGAAAPRVVDLDKQKAFPLGAWERPPAQAALLPISTSNQSKPTAVLVAGLNPHRLYNDLYQGFLSLIANQIASALTSARAYEDERVRAEALEELDRAKTTFFSNISHEFRTPLTLMLGPVEDLLAQQQEAPVAWLDRGALETVHRNAVRLQKLVNALLDFSRIEAGRMNARFQATDLPAFTAELASTFRSAMERAKLRFTVDCQAFSTLANIDAGMWEKIVLNLLSNALKYTFEGSVTLRLREAGGQVELSVADTGTGIPDKELPRLFERFHRVESARARTHEGTGIGLALVQELARLHGGTVYVTSELGKGSTFTVSIPLRAAPAGVSDADVIGAEPKPHPSQENAFIEEALNWLPQAGDSQRAASAPATPRQVGEPGKGHILLADDNADMRQYLQRLLETEYEVVVVSNGREALESALEQPPDLVLSDVMMPELDGFGLLQELRSNPATRSVPVVFLSARAGEEASAEGREAGADDYIVKPFSARELLARVRGTMLIGQERRRASERLNQIFEQAPVAILVLRGRDFVVELANPFYNALLPGRDLVGRRFAEALPEIGPHVFEAFHRVLDTGEPFTANEWLVPYDANRDGVIEDHWFNVVYNPWREQEGTVSGIIAVLTDITQQVQARQEVERVNRELEEFAYVASHDLQEPLRMVNIYSQLLVQRFGKVDLAQTQQYVEFIGNGVRRMEELIRDLLSFARTVQKETPALEAVPLRASLDKALGALRAQIEEKHATIEVEELPVVMGDETQLPQLFQNLVSNALKYSKLNVIPAICISCERGEKEWTIAVRDNGIGFKQEYGDHIFGLFKRLHKNEYEGTGLGLAICKRIVERFGGRIWVKSAPGEGSTFFFTLLGEGERFV